MASTFSPNKNYQLQGTGDNANTWGTILNANVFDIIDLNLGGRLSISVAGNANVAPTQAQAANIYHKLTGVLTGNISYVLPSAGGLFLINNATTGSFTVTVIPLGGTGIVIPQGSTVPVFINPDTGTAIQLFDTVPGALTAGYLNVTSSTVPANGIYLPSANTAGISANSLPVAQFASSGTVVNYFTLTSSATGVSPVLAVAGSDTNINLTLTPKGTGWVFAPNLNLTGASVPANGIYLSTTNTLGFAVNTTNVGHFTSAGLDSVGITISGTNYSSIIRSGVTGGNPVSTGTTDANQVLGLGNSSVTLRTGIYLSGDIWIQPSSITAYGTEFNLWLLPLGGNLNIGGGPGGPANYISINGATTGGSPAMQVGGTDTNVGWNFYTKGSGSFNFYGYSSANILFQINSVPSSVDYLYIQSAAASGTVFLGVAGTDTNIPIQIGSKGIAGVGFSSSTTGYIFICNPVASAVNYLQCSQGISGTSANITWAGSTNQNALLVASGTGKLACVGSYTNSTTASANVLLNSDGTFQRATSMRKYKTDIEDIEIDRAIAIAEKLRPVWFRSLCVGDDPTKSHYSFIADEVEELDPRLVHYGLEPTDTFDEKNQPILGKETAVGIQESRILTMAFVAHRAQIRDLQNQVSLLKSKLN